MSSNLEFNTKNFFQVLIFHPERGAQKDDRTKALACTILFGVFTLGIGPALVGLYQLGYVWSQYEIIEKNKDNLNSTEEKAQNIAEEQGVTPEQNEVEREKVSEEIGKKLPVEDLIEGSDHQRVNADHNVDPNLSTNPRLPRVDDVISDHKESSKEDLAYNNYQKPLIADELRLSTPPNPAPSSELKRSPKEGLVPESFIVQEALFLSEELSLKHEPLALTTTNVNVREKQDTFEEIDPTFNKAAETIRKQEENFRRREERQAKLMEHFQQQFAQETGHFNNRIQEIKAQNEKNREVEKSQSKKDLAKRIHDGQEVLKKQFEEEKKGIIEKYSLKAQEEEENKRCIDEGHLPKGLENDFDIRMFDKELERKQEELSLKFEKNKKRIELKYSLKKEEYVFEGDWESNFKRRELNESEKNAIEDEKKEALQDAELDHLANLKHIKEIHLPLRKQLIKKRVQELELEELRRKKERLSFTSYVPNAFKEISLEEDLKSLENVYEKKMNASKKELTSLWKDQEIQKDLSMFDKIKRESVQEAVQHEEKLTQISKESMSIIKEKNLSRLLIIPEFGILPDGEFKNAYEKIKKAHTSGDHKELFELKERYTKEDVEHSFRHLCLKIYPDKNPNLLSEAGELTTFLTLIKEDLLGDAS